MSWFVYHALILSSRVVMQLFYFADVDECTRHEGICDIRAQCNNTDGNYTCQCLHGWSGSGQQCQDVDECSTGLHSCHPRAACTNTNGSFTCRCKAGFMGDGYKCVDINECQTQHDCSFLAMCHNSPGSYNCICKEGLTGDGRRCFGNCSNNVITNNQGNFMWPPTTARSSANLTCPYGTVGSDDDAVAVRFCIETAPGEAAWAEPDTRVCKYDSDKTNILQDIAARGITQDNVLTVSQSLTETLSEDADQLTANDIDFTAQVLDDIIRIGGNSSTEQV